MILFLHTLDNWLIYVKVHIYKTGKEIRGFCVFAMLLFPCISMVPIFGTLRDYDEDGFDFFKTKGIILCRLSKKDHSDFTLLNRTYWIELCCPEQSWWEFSQGLQGFAFFGLRQLPYLKGEWFCCCYGSHSLAKKREKYYIVHMIKLWLWNGSYDSGWKCSGSSSTR